MRKIALKYIGGGRWLHGIPARDLSREEVKQHGGEDYLIGTGLYEAIRKPAKKVIVDDTTEG